MADCDIADQLMRNTDYRQFLKSLMGEVLEEKISPRIEKIESDIHSMKDDIDNMKQTRDADSKKTEKMEELLAQKDNEIDEIQQYLRRNCLRFSGIPETEGENTTQLIKTLAGEKLGVQLDDRDIDRSHRIGKPQLVSQGKHRQIIVKFTSYQPRSAVLQQRKKLKGTKMVISEDLTKKRLNLLKATSKHPSVSSAWSHDGKIYASVKTTTEGKNLIIPVHSTSNLKNFAHTSDKMTSDVPSSSLQSHPYATRRKVTNAK